MRCKHHVFPIAAILCMILIALFTFMRSQEEQNVEAKMLASPSPPPHELPVQLSNKTQTTMVHTNSLPQLFIRNASKPATSTPVKPTIITPTKKPITRKKFAGQAKLKSSKTTKPHYLKFDKVKLPIYESTTSLLPAVIERSSPSKELVLYSAHLFKVDHGKNYIIYLIGGGPTVYKSKAIIGCGVENRYSTRFKVRYVYESIRQHRWRKKIKKDWYRYQQLIVECYDIQPIKGDQPFLVYHSSSSNKTVRVFSDHPIVISAPRVPTREGQVSSVVCTKVLSKGVTWLPEFLRYQKTLGADHIHITILDTFIKDGGFHDLLANNSFFLKAVKDNYITFYVWKEWYGDRKWEWFYYGNILMYLDCIYRYRGTYDFVALMDTDDFFTIRVPGMTLNSFLKMYCYQKDIGSCSFRWLFYYPDICGLKDKVGEDGNVTASIVPHSPINAQKLHYKPIHLSKAIIDSSFHDASCSQCLVKGHKAVLIPASVAYVAHNRLNEKISAKRICP